MTWHRHPGGYEVFFNRDEKKTRQRATPPTVQVLHGVRYLAPRDGDAGGTWLLANEHGVTLALLNLWDESLSPNTPRSSRGRLLSDLLPEVRRAEEALVRLQTLPLEGYAGFTLAAFDLTQSGAPLAVRWDGQRLQNLKATMPVCSSGFDPAKVQSSRAESYLRQQPSSPAELWHWHTGDDVPSAYTVRMNRHDAQTWSISHVQVGPGAVCWRYREEMMDLACEPVDHNLQLNM